MADGFTELGIPKPCPFCGGNAREGFLTDFDHNPQTRYRVFCPHPSCSCSPSTKFYNTRQDALIAWNRRWPTNFG